MDNWERKSRKRTQSKGAPIKKWPDEWIWEPVTLGSSHHRVSHKIIGKILMDDIYECGFCKGSGQKPHGSRCSVCGGKGSVSVNPPAVICAFCRGKGEEKPRTNVTCTVCRGKGVIHVQEPVEKCPHCHSIGKEPTNKLPCIVCRGSGVVTVKEEIERERHWEGDQKWQKFQPQHKSAQEPREKTYHLPSGSEKEVLEIIYELGAADRAAVGRRMNVSSSYADYLCKSLVKTGLIIRDSAKYALTPEGEKLLEGKK